MGVSGSDGLSYFGVFLILVFLALVYFYVWRGKYGPPTQEEVDSMTHLTSFGEAPWTSFQGIPQDTTVAQSNTQSKLCHHGLYEDSEVIAYVTFHDLMEVLLGTATSLPLSYVKPLGHSFKLIYRGTTSIDIEGTPLPIEKQGG